MGNLLQSSQTSATTAPSFYTDYLSNLASSGQAAAQAAQFVGAQPLQEQAFNLAGTQAGAFQPGITAGQQLLGQAGAQDITGAASPYLQTASAVNPLSTATTNVGQGTSMSGLSAALPFMLQATQSPAQLAASYMNPYINTAVQGMSDIANRNIRQNLAPAATAAAVGAGQYGSQRGAQVLGQTQAQAMQDLNAQIAQMEQAGYGQALTAAGQQNALLASMGANAGSLTNQQAQNLINAGLGLGNLQSSYNQQQIQAAQTAANAAQQQAAIQQAAGLGMGTLASQGQQLSLNDINALATLGGQQQTILQNQQNYPLTKLTTLASLLQGYNVPTSTTTTMEMSPLSALAAAGTGLYGLSQLKSGSTGSSVLDSWLKSVGLGGSGSSTGGGTNWNTDGTPIDPNTGFPVVDSGTDTSQTNNSTYGPE